jgi:catechol 2,3-dioxygenase-like lactoylglutathione lyase family enzyme
MPIHHLGFKVPNYQKTRDFYLAALKPLGYKVTMSYEDGKVVGLGAGYYGADFWLVDPDVRSKEEKTDDEKATKYSHPIHIAFSASNRAQVREFHEAAMYACLLLLIQIIIELTPYGLKCCRWKM